MYNHPIYHWPPKSQWVSKPSVRKTWAQFGAYVHFPYCRNICDFCGYETRLISKSASLEFGSCATRQIRQHAEADDFTKSNLDAVFFGGGTASLMPLSGFASIVTALLALSPGVAHPEITLECEPGTIDREKLRDMKALGVNRVSVCAQALDDKLLGAIGRKHTNAQSMRLIEDCLAVGIENIHLDLMYGLPGQTTSLWEDTLVRAAGLPITHASAYKLYIFKYGALHRNNVIPRPESESEGATTILEDMYNLAHSVFADSRLCQYSLTEFARAGYRSKYIMGCFDGSDLLPIGPSAFGRANREIWDNSPYVHMYGTPDSALHDRALVLSPGEAFKRDLILGLWLLRASVGRLANRYEVTASCELLETLEQMKRDDLIAMENGEVILEQRHRFAAGVVMGRLADLELSEWIAGDATRGNIAERPNATWVFAGAAPTSDLAAVLRMARRDPEFFFGLDQDTTAALAVLERELGPDELDDLRQAILGTGEPSSSGLAQAWRTIRSEHVREPRTRQGDSSESRVFDAG